MTLRHTQTSGAPVHVFGLTKRYRDVTALDSVDLDIEAGEFITLLGASGSGKSTLLNIVAGFTKPEEGTVEVDGADLTRVPPHKRDLGVVFQHYALFPHMSVFDNVAFPLRRRRVSRDEVLRRVTQALATVELGELGNRRPSQLSGGQQQRVALARAIVFQPRVLLMDEPLGALDKRLREQLQLEIKRLHRELGITFVFVTHDQQEAMVMSDRIALLRDGHVVQIGTPEELYERPNELYAAEFLGDSNVFCGDLNGAEIHHRSTGGIIKVSDHRTDCSDAAVVVRPERVTVRAPQDSISPGCNTMTGTVAEVVYLGSGRRIEVEVADGTRIVARTAAGSDVPLAPGASVVVCWEIADGIVVPHTGGTSERETDDPMSVV